MEQDIDVGVEVPEVPDLPQVKDGEKDTTDWKAIAQERQEALAKMQGMTKRFQTKLKKLAEAPKPEGNAPKPAAAQASQGPDYAKLGYLESKGITEEADQQWLEQIAGESKTELKDVLKKDWVQKELAERKAVRTTAAATPPAGASKRAGNQTPTEVDYWIAQGKLPPNTPENQELRRKVVNARQARESSGNVFTSNPVVGGSK